MVTMVRKCSAAMTSSRAMRLKGNVSLAAYLEASNSSFLNNGVGIRAGVSTLRLLDGTISGSGDDGMTMRGGSTAVFRGPTITGNGGNGVHLEDGSFAGFDAAIITGNLSGVDVDCAPQFPITRFVDERAVLQTALSLSAMRS